MPQRPLESRTKTVTFMTCYMDDTYQGPYGQGGKGDTVTNIQ